MRPRPGDAQASLAAPTPAPRARAPSERRPRSAGGAAAAASVAPWRRGGVAAGNGPEAGGRRDRPSRPEASPRAPARPFPGRRPGRKVRRALALVRRRRASPGDVRDGKGRSFNGTDTVPRVFMQIHENRLCNYSNDSETVDRGRSFLQPDTGQARHMRPAAPLTVGLGRARTSICSSPTWGQHGLLPPRIAVRSKCDETREPFRTRGGRRERLASSLSLNQKRTPRELREPR